MSTLVMDDKERRPLYSALWNRDVRLSPMPVRAVSAPPMDRNLKCELEFRELADRVLWGSEATKRDLKENSTGNKICKRSDKNQCYCWRCLLAGGVFLVMLLIAAIVFLLPLYFQQTAQLHRNQEEGEALFVNQSHWMERIMMLRKTSFSLNNNLSTLKQNLSSLRDILLPHLELIQTQLLQEIGKLEMDFVNSRNHFRDLGEMYNELKENYCLIPQESPLLQNCMKRESGTDYIECPYCPARWHLHGLSCYLMSPEAQSWVKSSNWCHQNGGHLVVINSMEEQTFIQALVNRTVWIGLTDHEMEGDWRWEDGSPYASHAKFWLSDQPDNAGDEDCVTLSTVGGWSDDNCGMLYTSVCEDSVSELILPGDALPV